MKTKKPKNKLSTQKQKSVKTITKKVKIKKRANTRFKRKKKFSSILFTSLLIFFFIALSAYSINYKFNSSAKNTDRTLLKISNEKINNKEKITSESIITKKVEVNNIVENPATETNNSFCVYTPVLMYHHVEPIEQAKKDGHAQLTVDSGMFEQHITYLIDKGYTFYSAEDLINAVASHTPLSGKPIVITLDDGYMDNYLYAFQTAKKYNIKLSIFIATGLLNNPGYMNWDNLREMTNSGLVFIYDHTWSHYALPKADYDKAELEIMTAKKQLEENLGKEIKIFAYPYGSSTDRDVEILKKNGFTGAFSTIQSNYQCENYIYNLRRTRIGNAPLSYFGF